MQAYLENYTKANKLGDHITLSTRASGIRRIDNEWSVQLENTTTSQVRRETFDKVCVAIGTFHSPRSPTFDGVDKFAGDIIHSIQFHEARKFQDQNVLIVGLGASAQDCVTSLSGQAKKIYLSHRSGALFLPRFGADEYPTDSSNGISLTFMTIQLEKYLPRLWAWLLDTIANRMSEKAFPNPPRSWRLRPSKSLQVSTPVIADALWGFLKSGFAEPVAAVQGVTGSRSIRLQDGRVLDNVDAIIYW